MQNFTKSNIKKWALSLITVFIITLAFENKSIAQETDVPPSNISISNISNTSAQINWDYSLRDLGFITQFSVHYRLPNDIYWTWAGSTSLVAVTNSYTIKNLAPNTTYIATVDATTNEGYQVPAIYPINSVTLETVTFTTGGGVANQLPVCNAGPDQTITLPTNAASLSGSGTDTDGTIASYAWSVVSGPNTPAFGNANSAATSISNLLQGTYTLQLRVTDNLGATATDLVVINVNPAIVVTCINDNFEPNNTSSAARAISVGSSILAKICPLNDIDFFSFSNSTSAKNIRVTLSTLPTNYIVELYAPNGTLAGSRTTAGTANKVIVFNTSTVGTYRVRVLAGTGAVANNSNYTLRVETAKNAFAAAKSGNVQISNFSTTQRNLMIYPNPTKSGFVYIDLQSDELFKSISMYSATGQLITKIVQQKGIVKLDVSTCKNGLYYINATSKDGLVYSSKLIIVN
jgi:hypothetical protein